MRLLAYIINGQILGIDINSWKTEDLNGNKPFIYSETVLDGYSDITSIENIDRLGLIDNKDYIYVKDRIREVADSKGGFNSCTTQEKYILIKYYCYRDLVTEKITFLMTEGLTQEQSIEYLVKLWFKHNKNGFIDTIKLRWKFSQFYLLTMCYKDSVEVELERDDISHSLHLMSEYGIVGTGYGDVNTKGIMDYFESTGNYVLNGFLESNIIPYTGITKEMIITKIQDIMINGNYDASICNE